LQIFYKNYFSCLKKKLYIINIRKTRKKYFFNKKFFNNNNMKKHEIIFSIIKIPLDFFIVFFVFFLARDIRKYTDLIP
jgi:hypothetical protein